MTPKRRVLAAVGGAAVGLGGAGLAVALLLPVLPAAWRSEAVVWTLALVSVALGVAVSAFATRQPRP